MVATNSLGDMDLSLASRCYFCLDSHSLGALAIMFLNVCEFQFKWMDT